MNQSFTNTTIISLVMIIAGLLIVFVWTPHTNFKAEMGLSLITAGIVSLTIDNISIKEISIRLNKVVEDGLHELVMKRYGIVEITANTPYAKIYSAMTSSKEFTLVQTWSPDMKNILDHCESILGRGGTVTIFLLHPESPAAKQRSLDLQEQIEHVPEKIRSDAKQIRSMYHRLDAKQIEND